MQKKAWLNDSPTARPFQESVFFSIWVKNDTITQSKLFYNIHALKLRELTAYTIKSRDFAEVFRQRFKSIENEWPNVSTAFGPLTLMEGWVSLGDTELENSIADLAHKFLQVAPIIDDLLAHQNKQKQPYSTTKTP